MITHFNSLFFEEPLGTNYTCLRFSILIFKDNSVLSTTLSAVTLDSPKITSSRQTPLIHSEWSDYENKH